MNKLVYFIYFKGWEPPALLLDSPYPAQYPPKNSDGTDPEGPIILLFVRGCKEVTGEEPVDTMELFKEGLNHPFNEGGQGLTKEELMVKFDYLITVEPSGIETVALISQCDVIYNARFKPKPELEEVSSDT
jgi:hypothetical protein